MMVRSEVMRGRFRNSFSKPEPFVANKKTAVNIKLQDVMHTFKRDIKSNSNSKHVVSFN
jgi:predicted acyl esterase